MDKQLNFMIVDDDEIFNYLIKSVIEKSERTNQVESFVSSVDALSWMHGRIDMGLPLLNVLLLDIRMPVMTGLDLLEKISKFPEKALSGFKVCMLTSSLSERDKEACMAYPFVMDFISKPFTREKFASLLEKFDLKDKQVTSSK
ncbi:MAG: response regulator [Bacteroidota bacterium]